MEAKILSLERENTQAETWRTRMEDKLDKILWFLLGQSVTLVGGILVGVAIYAFTN